MGALEGSLISQLEAWKAQTAFQINGIAYPNREYEPPDYTSDVDVGWMRCTFIPAETLQATVGDTGMNEMAGVMVLNLFWPKGRLAGPANAIADDLISWFKRGTTCPVANGYSAKIVKAWRDAPLLDDRWFNVPIRVRWYQHVPNT